MSWSTIEPDVRAGLGRPVRFVRVLLPGSVVGRVLFAPFLVAATLLAVYVLGAFVLAILDAALGLVPAKVDDGGWGADDAWIIGTGVVVGAGGYAAAVVASAVLAARRRTVA